MGSSSVVGGAKRGSVALLGGGQTTTIYEDGPEAAAVWGVCENILEGNVGGIGTKVFIPTSTSLKVGYIGIPNRAYTQLVSMYYKSTHAWNGLRWRS